MGDGPSEILTPEEVAARLKLGVDDVVRAAEAGELSGFKLAGQWRFAAASLPGASTPPPAPARRPSPSPASAPAASIRSAAEGLPETLEELLPLSHILPASGADDGRAIIHEVATAAAQLGLIRDQAWFEKALVDREAMMSTAVEGGLAFLHARQTANDHVVRPFVLLARAPQGIPFGAPDGSATQLFLTLGLKYDRLHLRWLSRLARILRCPEVVASLVAAPTVGDVHEILVGRDRSC